MSSINKKNSAQSEMDNQKMLLTAAPGQGCVAAAECCDHLCCQSNLNVQLFQKTCMKTYFKLKEQIVNLFFSKN